jgi:ferredoxin
MSTLRLSGLGIELPVKRSETILSALCRAGMTYTYGCRRGGCGICTATVRSGSTSYEGKAVAESALSSQRRAQGVVLTCRAVPVTDVVEAEFAPESRLRLTRPLAFKMASGTRTSVAGGGATGPNTSPSEGTTVGIDTHNPGGK